MRKPPSPSAVAACSPSGAEEPVAASVALTVTTEPGAALPVTVTPLSA